MIRNINQLFSQELLDEISRDTGFISRKGKIDAATFLSFNSFLSEDICEKSLATLSSRLSSHYIIFQFLRKLLMSALMILLLNI